MRKCCGSEPLLSAQEIAYLKTQHLARIATASPKGEPEVSPVAFEFDGEYFYVGSHDQSIFFKTRRYQNIKKGNARVSFVIDDLESVDPWKPRGIKVRGTAEVVEHKGIFGKGSYLRITPQVSVSWGIEPAKEGQWASKKVHNR
jgi:pyridoxamine 5'-phosphate oxidase family protein